MISPHASAPSRTVLVALVLTLAATLSHAASDDPCTVDWLKSASNPLFGGGFSGGSFDAQDVRSTCVLEEGGTYKMWYTGMDTADPPRYRIGFATSSDGIEWTPYGPNPVIDLGPPGAFDDWHACFPVVIRDGDTYKMWYTGDAYAVFFLGYATSSDGIHWTKYPGPHAGAIIDWRSEGWDRYTAAGSVIKDGSVYRMWFGAYGSSQGIGYATSVDGISWDVVGQVLTIGFPGTFEEWRIHYPSVARTDTGYLMLYSGQDQSELRRFGMATSPDGANWTKCAGNPVLPLGGAGEWDAVLHYCPYVLVQDGRIRLWYSGMGAKLSMGYAESFYQNVPGGPVVTAIDDVPNDQGRAVRIRFDASPYDRAGSTSPVVQYEAFRRIDGQAASLGSPPGRHGSPVPRGAMISSPGALLEQWEFAGSLPAHGEPAYAMIAPTLFDSTNDGGEQWSVFFVRAATTDPLVYFDSTPDSGCSVDNLAPAIPGGLRLEETMLSWDECPDPDFDYFTVYGSDDGNPATAFFIGYTVSPEMNVEESPYAWYHVTSTDFSGNVGDAASVRRRSEPTSAPFDLALPHPNPTGGDVTVSFNVPGEAHARLSIHDLTGQVVRTLLDRPLDAGHYAPVWDGRDSKGRVTSAGIYFVRLECGESCAVRKLVRVN